MLRVVPSFVVTIFLFAIDVIAQGIPKGFVVPKCTLSPDRRYGVTVPILDLDQPENPKQPKNSIIELETGRIIAVINTRWTGWTKHNHGGVLPCRWSADGSLLLWEVDGKWFRDAVVLLKIKNGALEWQLDITEKVQREILRRTKHSVPKKYS